MFTHVSVHSCTDCLISNGFKCVIGTQYYPYSKCDHSSCHIVEMFICKLRNIFFVLNEILLAVFYIQTFLCAILLRGRGHGVPGSSKRTHDLQRARPVIPGPEKAGKIESVTCSGMHCFVV